MAIGIKTLIANQMIVENKLTAKLATTIKPITIKIRESIDSLTI